MTQLEAVSILEKCMSDARKEWFAMGYDSKVSMVNVHLVASMWGQVWGDTRYGFDGVGGQAFTERYTVVLHNRQTGERRIYHHGMYAYTIKEPTALFLMALRDQDLPGKHTYDMSPFIYDETKSQEETTL